MEEPDQRIRKNPDAAHFQNASRFNITWLVKAENLFYSSNATMPVVQQAVDPQEPEFFLRLNAYAHLRVWVQLQTWGGPPHRKCGQKVWH